jgi:Tol biopolymer transport system component
MPRTPATAAMILILLTLAWFTWRRQVGAGPFEQIRITRLTSSGNATVAATSPDGQYLVYAISHAGLESLWFRQIASSNSVQIEPPAKTVYKYLAFSPAGNNIYILRSDDGFVTDLFEMPALGGAARQVMKDVDSNVAVSPDGSKLAFMRYHPRTRESTIITIDSDGSNARTIATRKRPEFFGAGISWSPDGKLLACTAGRSEKERIQAGVVTIPASGGFPQATSFNNWDAAFSVSWADHGRGLIVETIEHVFDPAQLWYVPLAGGRPRRITNDLADYSHVNVSANSSKLVAVQTETRSNIWASTDSNLDSLRRITLEPASEAGVTGVTWAGNSSLVYTSRIAGKYELSSMGADGANAKQLTYTGTAAVLPRVSLNRSVFFVSNRANGNPHVFAMDIAGGTPRQVTDGSGEHLMDCTRDGKWVLFNSLGSPQQFLFRVPATGGTPGVAVDSFATSPSISPDGRLVAVAYLDPKVQPHRGTAVFRLDGGPALRRFEISSFNDNRFLEYDPVRWTPDGKMLTYSKDENGVSNIWGQPVGGGSAVQLTHFDSDHIFFFDWSPEGRFVCSRGEVTKDVVLLQNAR